jgi:hypothetical protein
VKNIPLIGYLSQAWQGVFVSTRVGHTGESVASQIAQRGTELGTVSMRTRVMF